MMFMHSFDQLIFINRALFTIAAMLSRNRINLLKINKNSMTEQPTVLSKSVPLHTL